MRGFEDEFEGNLVNQEVRYSLKQEVYICLMKELKASEMRQQTFYTVLAVLQSKIIFSRKNKLTVIFHQSAFH